MESILSIFVFHDTYVVSFLVIAITIVVVLLLLINQRTPDHSVSKEIGGDQELESTLRRVLGEQTLTTEPAGGMGADSLQKLDDLEKEVLEKDRKIAELNKQLTQSGPVGDGGELSENGDLMTRISELEARLQEYEIIEDDIADLSLYKSENEKLKEELARLKGILNQKKDEPDPGEDDLNQPEPEEPNAPEEEEGSPLEANQETAADLVAEFEKVVNNQAELTTDSEKKGDALIEDDIDAGKVVMADSSSGTAEGGSKSPRSEAEVHPKLREVSPDSKDEAEVFIAELKSLKKGS